jgi:hypothetical protein
MVLINQTNFIGDVMPNGYKYSDLPKITHQPNFVGRTDYIDKIYPEHLTHYVTRGCDQYKRLYLIVYYKNNIQTYFQRYSDSANGIWSYGEYLGGNSKDFILCHCGEMTSKNDNMIKLREVIAELLKSNKILII